MYVIQEEPDSAAQLANGAHTKPLATLKDEHGGISHIIMDDGCYVLINKAMGTNYFAPTKHWYKEAAAALILLQ